MKGPNRIYGFLMIYLSIMAISVIGNLYGIRPNFSTSNTWIYSISLATLTHLNTGIMPLPVSNSFYIFSLLITQISGLLVMTMLLWLCWQLFGNLPEKSFPLTKALRYTFIFSLIIELILFGFFLYSIPKELTNDSLNQKILASLSLAVNSFNNSGFTLWSHYLKENVLSTNFMVQVGIIAGSTLGNLGIFVIIELFSPLKLRQRLNNPSVDWTFITKLSFFGSAAIMILFVVIYHLFGNQDFLLNKNILETISYILLEGANARGFGFDLSIDPLFKTEILRTAYSFFGAGPFSSGGGIGLLFFVFAYALIKGKNNVTEESNTAFSIVKNWLYVTVICIGISLFVLIFSSPKMRFTEVFLVYNSNHINLISSEESVPTTIVTIFLNLSGRISLIIACMITLNQIKHASRSL